jgi:hypothetical protein
MVARRSPEVVPDVSPAVSSPSVLHLHRADGLDVELSGDAVYVTAMFERLVALLGLAPILPP